MTKIQVRSYREKVHLGNKNGKLDINNPHHEQEYLFYFQIYQENEEQWSLQRKREFFQLKIFSHPSPTMATAGSRQLQHFQLCFQCFTAIGDIQPLHFNKCAVNMNFHCMNSVMQEMLIIYKSEFWSSPASEKFNKETQAEHKKIGKGLLIFCYQAYHPHLLSHV